MRIHNIIPQEKNPRPQTFAKGVIDLAVMTARIPGRAGPTDPHILPSMLLTPLLDIANHFKAIATSPLCTQEPRKYNRKDFDILKLDLTDDRKGSVSLKVCSAATSPSFFHLPFPEPPPRGCGRRACCDRGGDREGLRCCRYRFIARDLNRRS